MRSRTSPPASGSSKSISRSRSASGTPRRVTPPSGPSGPPSGESHTATSASASSSRSSSTGHQPRCSSMWPSSSARKSRRPGRRARAPRARASRTSRPPGGSPSGRPRRSPSRRAAARDLTASGAISSSSLPTTSGSLVTASTTVSARTALSEEYDVRRQAASTVRVKERTPSTGHLRDRGRSRPARAGVASSGAGTAAVAPLREERDRVVVGRDLRLVGDLRRVGRPHQHPVQRRGEGVLGRRPPADDLGLRAGEGDVQQAQPLAGVLLLGPADVVGPPGTAGADVAAAPALVVVEARQVGLGDVAVGDGGQVDDGVLEALARVDRHQLHGGRVAVETAGALEPAAGAALADLLAQPGQQRDQAVPLGQRDLVQGLADVPQVGEPPVAADLGQHPGRQAGDARRLHHGGQAAAAEQLEPRPQRLGDLVGEVVAAGVEVGGGVAEEAGQRGRPHAGAAVRLLERLEQRQPVGRRPGSRRRCRHRRSRRGRRRRAARPGRRRGRRGGS